MENKFEDIEARALKYIRDRESMKTQELKNEIVLENFKKENLDALSAILPDFDMEQLKTEEGSMSVLIQLIELKDDVYGANIARQLNEIGY